MAKTTKRIVSLVIVAMLLAAMVPFTAFAANPSLTLSMTKDGFTYTVYQVATLDTTTGGYTLNTADEGIVAAMKTKNQTGADFLAALDAASNPGSVAGTVTKDSSFTTSTMGIYYAKATEWPNGVQRKSNTVVVPQYNDTDKTWEFSDASIDLSANGKAVSGDVGVDKGFDTVDDKAPKFKGQGQKVTYTLEATIVGSIDQKAKKYVIYDTMSKGLTYNNDAKVYYLDDADHPGNEVTEQFTVKPNNVDSSEPTDKLTGEYEGGTYITVTAKPETLNGTNSTEFYAAKKVRVVYTATVNNKAVVGNPGNPNTDGLEYTNAAGTDGKAEGFTVRVYTYNIEVEKVDASNGNRPLAGAIFGLYSDSKATTEIASGTSVISGNKAIVTFKAGSDANAIRLAPGTYYVKEKAAPAGYNLNTTIYEVTVTGDTTPAGGVQGLQSAIPNTISKLPQTGGAGTMMFTILGGSLILVAGVLFVVFMKKRSSK